MFLPDCLPDSSLASAHLTKKSWAPANSAALTLPWHSEEGLEFQPTEQLVQSIFTMLCSIERNIKLKYIHRDCVIFSYLSTKRRAFILVHTASLISFPSTSSSLLSLLHYVWLALDSLAICHCQLKYWIYILFTYLKPAHYQRAKSNFTSSTKLSQYPSTRSLISMSDFFWLKSDSINIFSNVLEKTLHAKV